MRKIDKLISEARSQSRKRGIDVQRKLDERRKSAIERIASAAQKHLRVDDNPGDEEVLYQRIWDADRARISETEAMAAMAERGDFASKLFWLNIEHEKVALWKGYVVAGQQFKHSVLVGPDGGSGAGLPREQTERVMVIVQTVADPGAHAHGGAAGRYIANVFGKHGSVVWLDDIRRKAAVDAYVQYMKQYKGLPLYEPVQVPDELIRELDRFARER